MHLRYEKNPSETGALLNLRDLRANSPASDTYRSRTMSCTVQYIVTATAQPTIAFCEKASFANEDWDWIQISNLFELSNLHRTLNFRTYSVPKHRE